MRRIAIFICISLGTISFAAAQTKQEIRIGVDEANPPFSRIDIDGNLSGFDIDLANLICKRVKPKCSFVKLDWNNILPALRGNKIDLAIAAIRPTDQRREQVAFSTPYLHQPSLLITHKNSTLSGIAPDDLLPAKIGVLKSSPHAEYLRVYFPDIKPAIYNDPNKYFQDLANQRLDAVIGNPLRLHYFLKSAEGENCCRILGQLEIDPKINGEGYAIAVRKDDEKLLTTINKVLAKLSKNRKLPKLTRKYFPFLK